MYVNKLKQYMKKLFGILTGFSALLITFTGCYDPSYDPGCNCYPGDPGYGNEGAGDQVGSYAPYGMYSSGPLSGYPSDQSDIGYYDQGINFSSSRSGYSEHQDLLGICDIYGWEYIGVNNTWEEKYDMQGYYIEGYYEMNGYYTFGRMANPDGSQDTIWLAQMDPITKIWKQIDVNTDSIMALRNISM